MASIPDVIERWLDVLHGRKSYSGRPLENLGGSNVYGSGSVLYSYGSHFHLAEYYRAGPIRDLAGGRIVRRRRALFLVNSDRFSVSTSRHQRETISAINRRAVEFSAEVLLLPFSALAAAGIVHGSISPLEIRPDEWLTVERAPVPVDSFEPETADSYTDETEPVYGHVQGSGWTNLGESTRRRYRWRAGGYTFERSAIVAGVGADRPLGSVHVRSWPSGAPHELDTDGPEPELITRRHRMGDSVFMAAVAGRRTVRRSCTVADVIAAAVSQCRQDRRLRPEDRTGPGPLDLLDVSAPIAETRDVWRRRRFVSSFDTNEPAAAYFLATLPGSSRATSVAMAIEDLAPAAVHAALARGRDVRRQGDIFAIETDLADVPAEWPRARLTRWTRGARALPSEPGYVAPLRAADRRRIVAIARRMWRARWRDVSPRGPFTTNGARARYAKVGAERARRIESARLAGRRAILRAVPTYRRYGDTGLRLDGLEWARDGLESARHFGDSHGYLTRAHSRDVYRRHEPPALALWRQCLTAAYEQVRPAARPHVQTRAVARARDLLTVHGTAHTATEVARGPGGTVYVRGMMRHEPALIGENRARDHVAVRLGDGSKWYLAVRNTVPRASRDGRRP